MSAKTFTCENCRQTFDKEPEADTKAQAEWASVKEWEGEPQAVICDDCWLRMAEWAKKHKLPWPTCPT
jgi:hypothetical protein